MIYFDNAATSHFRPDSVLTAFESSVKYISANPGRSGHRLSVLGEQFIYRTRKKLNEIFNNGSVERVCFTKNCSEALNTAIFGLYNGGSIVTTVTEHNSVLRPLYALEQKGARLKFAKPHGLRGITANDILPLIDEETTMVVVNAVSNVTGIKNNFEEIGIKLNKLQNKICYIVDGAQAAGHIEINMKACSISAFAVAGHKGLYAIPGASALLFSDDFDIQPLMYGGSGTESFEKIPHCYPELLEAGTLNLPAIASLYDGASYAEGSLHQSAERLNYHTAIIISGLKKLKGVKCFSEPNPFGIVAFSMPTSSVEVAEKLSENFDIAVRGGFHCAPLMHKHLKTDGEGLVRVSLAPQNTDGEIYKFLRALKTLNEG